MRCSKPNCGRQSVEASGNCVLHRKTDASSWEYSTTGERVSFTEERNKCILDELLRLGEVRIDGMYWGECEIAPDLETSKLKAKLLVLSNCLLDRLTIKNLKLKQLTIDTSKAFSPDFITLDNVEIEALHLTLCDTKCSFHIKITQCKIQHCWLDLYSVDKSSNNHLRLCKSFLGSIACKRLIAHYAEFNNCIFHSQARFEHVELERLQLSNNTYFYCPEFSLHDLEHCKQIILPTKKEFRPFYTKTLRKIWWTLLPYTVVCKLAKFHKKIHTQKLVLDNSVNTLEQQHRNLEVLYAYALNRRKHDLKNDYYYLIRRCAEINPNTALATRWISRFYRFLSGYGTRLGTPCILLLVLWGVCGVYFANVHTQVLSHGLLTSAHYIVKPFSEFVEDNLMYVEQWVAFLESLLAVILFIMLAIALKTNFEKKNS
ncbi:MAG: hypothetical protein Tsb005_20090 [Gammaproteobacteria bacterium]